MGTTFRTASLLSVAGVRTADMAVQFLTPLLLVRLLSQNDFGDYRIFWLLINTVMFVAPLGMPRSLFYFLPKTSLPSKSLSYVANAAIVSVSVTAMIVITGWLLSNFLPETVATFVERYGIVVACFAVVWSFATLWENLPNALEDHTRQSLVSMVMTVLRVGAVIGLARVTGNLAVIFWSVLSVGLIQAAYVAFYIRGKLGANLSQNSWPLFTAQFAYAAPYGLAGSASSLRRNVDQWIVVGRFSSGQFAVLSLASTLLMPFEMLRSTANNMLLPRLSRANTRGVKRSMVLYRRVAPAYFALFSFAAGACYLSGAALAALFFGAGYALSGTVMFFYLLQVTVQTLGGAAVFSLVGKGERALGIAIFQIALSIIGTLVGIQHFGLIGAVGGPLLSTIFGDTLTMFYLTRLAGIRIISMHRWRVIGYLLVGFTMAALFADIGIDRLNYFDHYTYIFKLLIFSVICGIYLKIILRYGSRQIVSLSKFFQFY